MHIERSIGWDETREANNLDYLIDTVLYSIYLNTNEISVIDKVANNLCKDEGRKVYHIMFFKVREREPHKWYTYYKTETDYYEYHAMVELFNDQSQKEMRLLKNLSSQNPEETCHILT